MRVQAGRDGHVAFHHIPAGGQIVPFVVIVENAFLGFARQHGVFGAVFRLTVFIQIGDRIGGDRHCLHPLRHQLHVFEHRVIEIPLRQIDVLQIGFVIPADKGMSVLDRVSGSLHLLSLQNLLWSDRAASIGIKGDRPIQVSLDFAACQRTKEAAAGDLTIVYHIAGKLAAGDSAVVHHFAIKLAVGDNAICFIRNLAVKLPAGDFAMVCHFTIKLAIGDFPAGGVFHFTPKRAIVDGASILHLSGKRAADDFALVDHLA